MLTLKDPVDAVTQPAQAEDNADLLISPANASTSATLGLTTISRTEGEAGLGELNNAATWDDFPNGRFGDFKSPAFGDQDLWGGSSLSVRSIFWMSVPCIAILLMLHRRA